MSRLFVFVLLCAFCFSHAATCLPPDVKSHTADSEMRVEATSMAISETGGRRQITTIGKITNPTPSCFEDVVIEVTYYDDSGKLVDTITQELRSVVVPPMTDVNFRTVDAAMKASNAYVSQKTRLINAEYRYARASKQKPETNVWIDLLVSWGPMLLLIAVWMIVMRTYMGKKSPQYKTLAALERQISVSESQLKAFERIAAAVESVSNNRSGV